MDKLDAHPVYRRIKIAALALALILFALFLRKQWMGLDNAARFVKTAAWGIPFFALFFLAGMALNVRAWLACLRMYQPGLSTRDGVTVWMRSIPMRYLPGSVASVWWRGDAAATLGLSVGATLMASAFESFILVLSAFPFLYILARAAGFAVSWWPALLLLGLLAVMLHPRIVARLNQKASGALAVPETRYTVSGAVQTLLFIEGMWLCWGAGLFFLAGGFRMDWSLIAVMPALPAAAWLSGAMTIIAPRGFGAQEACLIYFLGQHMSYGEAAILALLYRLLSSVLEMAAWAVFRIWEGRAGRPAS